MDIAVCDDEINVLDEVYSKIHSWKDKGDDKLIVWKFSSGEKLITAIDDGHTFDLYILDIQLEGMNGFVLGKSIRKKYSEVPIVFLTNYDTFIREAYEIQAYRYLAKPVRQEDIDNSLTYALRVKLKGSRSLVVSTGDGRVIIKFNDILRISQAYHHIIICKLSGTIEEWSRISFEKYIEDKRLDFRFVRISRSDIINMDHVERYTVNDIEMDNGENVTISRKYRNEVIYRLELYFTGKVVSND